MLCHTHGFMPVLGGQKWQISAFSEKFKTVIWDTDGGAFAERTFVEFFRITASQSNKDQNHTHSRTLSQTPKPNLFPVLLNVPEMSQDHRTKFFVAVFGNVVPQKRKAFV